MIGGKKETPAARAALARRRQRIVSKSEESPETTHTSMPYSIDRETTPRVMLSSSTVKETEMTDWSKLTEPNSNNTTTSRIIHFTPVSTAARVSEDPAPQSTTRPPQKIKKSEVFSSKELLLAAAKARLVQSEPELQEEDEDDEVVEEPERISTNEALDALCLSSDSNVSVTPCFILSTLIISAENDALLTGVGLGHADETLQITLATPNAINGMLRYGDAVSFYSRKKQKYLGIHSNASRVAFSSSVIGLGERWSVLHPARRLWIGRAALDYMKTTKRQPQPTELIRSGESVVLRNHLNGGLLSVNVTEDGFELAVYTDAYDTSICDESAMNRLQHHDRIIPSIRDTFRIVLSNVPLCPHWIGDNAESFQLTEESPSRGKSSALVQNSMDQERLLVDEIITSMMGLEGDMIRIIKSPKLSFVLERNIHLTPSLRNLCDFILPLSTSFIRIRRFLKDHVPGYEFGRVLQALCQAIDEMLQEYLRDIVAISHEYRNSHLVGEIGLTLNNLFVKVQQPRHQLSIVERVILEAKTKKGGCLLNALRELKMRMFVGDSQAQGILQHLLDRSSVPYMEILSAWLERGILADPCKEFMIQRSDQATFESSYNGDSWEGLFIIVAENVLDGVLSPPTLRDKVLATGKYLNAVHFCETGAFVGHSAPVDEQTCTENFVYNMDQVSLALSVDRLYQSASKDLLRRILCDYNLQGTLRTMKNYFLLDQGDFLLNFLDDAETELSKDSSEVSRGRIQHWFNMALQAMENTAEDSSSISTMFDPLHALQPLSASLIRCDFAANSLIAELDALHSLSGGVEKVEPKTPSKYPYGTVNGLTGTMTFMLGFRVVEFPSCLFISERNLLKYQQLFRHLFFAKNVERRLVGIWSDHQTMKVLQDLHGPLRRTYCLRQKMLHFMQNLMYYMMLEVIEPNWRELMKKIGEQHQRAIDIGNTSASHTVDSLIDLHNSFLDQSSEQCLLSNRAVVQSLTKLMSTCLLFSEQMDRFMNATKIVSSLHSTPHKPVISSLTLLSPQNEENEVAANQKRSAIQKNLNSVGKRSMSKTLFRKVVAQEQEERHDRISKQTARVERELDNESFKRMIKRYGEVFDSNLAEFMQILQSQPTGRFQSHIANLCMRLDFNGFVTQQLQHN